MTDRDGAAEGVRYPLGMSRSLRLAVASALQRRRQRRHRRQQWAVVTHLLNEINTRRPNCEVGHLPGTPMARRRE